MDNERPLDSFIEARRREIEAEREAEEAKRARRVAREERRRQLALQREGVNHFEAGVPLGAVFSQDDVLYCHDFLARAASRERAYCFNAIACGFFRTSLESILSDGVYGDAHKEKQRRAAKEFGRGLVGYPIGHTGCVPRVLQFKQYEGGSPHLAAEVIVICGDARLRTGTGRNITGSFRTGSFEVVSSGVKTTYSFNKSRYANPGDDYSHYPYKVVAFRPSPLPEALARTLVDLLEGN
jgi:hypothetical protein